MKLSHHAPLTPTTGEILTHHASLKFTADEIRPRRRWGLDGIPPPTYQAAVEWELALNRSAASWRRMTHGIRNETDQLHDAFARLRPDLDAVSGPGPTIGFLLRLHGRETEARHSRLRAGLKATANTTIELLDRIGRAAKETYCNLEAISPKQRDLSLRAGMDRSAIQHALDEGRHGMLCRVWDMCRMIEPEPESESEPEPELESTSNSGPVSISSVTPEVPYAEFEPTSNSGPVSISSVTPEVPHAEFEPTGTSDDYDHLSSLLDRAEILINESQMDFNRAIDALGGVFPKPARPASTTSDSDSDLVAVTISLPPDALKRSHAELLAMQRVLDDLQKLQVMASMTARHIARHTRAAREQLALAVSSIGDDDDDLPPTGRRRRRSL
ncbi:hypothetical protein PG984_011879 [Apiospora sp. TS-2023a]